jgi:hypothetical protein
VEAGAGVGGDLHHHGGGVQRHVMKLAIGGPTSDQVPAPVLADVAWLFAYTREMGPWGRDVSIGWLASTYIHVGRELYLQAMLAQDVTHILWLDTDMSVPRTTAVRLAAHDVPIVGCNYRTRRRLNGPFTAQREDGQRVPTLDTSTGLEAVAACGFGVLLMDVRILQGVPRPMFRHGLNLENGDIGEDVMWCRTLRAAGHTVYIDHDLSKEVGHIGQHTYGTIEREAVTT